MNDSFLKYMGNGVFYQYRVENGKHVYKYEVRDFNFGECISIGWEIVEDVYFKNNLK